MSAAKPKAPKKEFVLPDGYPLTRDQVPSVVGAGLRGMPLDIFHLMHFGKVTAEDFARYGWRPMQCADCQDRPLELQWMHPPVPLADFSKAVVLPGCIWGVDVSQICACCSFPSTCPHKTPRAAKWPRRTEAQKAERAARLANEQELRRADKLIGELADALEALLARSPASVGIEALSGAAAALAKARLP